MQSIINDLYHGRVGALRGSACRAENKEVYRHIEEEQRYFLDKMNPEDRARFQRLDLLMEEIGISEDEFAFTAGFRLGVRMTAAAFADDQPYENIAAGI